jgi:competence protein ComFA
MKWLLPDLTSAKVLNHLQEWEEEGVLHSTPAIKHSPWAILRKCNRCGAGASFIKVSTCANCGSKSCAYCTRCLFLGRVKSCTPLFFFLPRAEGQTDLCIDITPPFAKAQQQTLQKLINKYESSAEHIHMLLLLGSGELIILSNFIVYLLQRKKRIFWCQDQSKIAKTWNQLALLVPKLFSYIEDDNGSVVLGSQWDLLTYHRQFDVVIWDGVTPETFHAWGRAIVPKGKQISIHATLPSWIQVDIKHPVRLHNYPLPMPKFIQYRSLRQHLTEKKPIHPLILFVKEVLALNGQAWILVPSSKDVEKTMKWMEKVMPDVAIKTCCMYQEEDEADEIRILFSEQKFTFLLMPQQMAENMRIANLHLCLLHADHPIFDRRRLVELSHFIGLNSYFPECEIWFIGETNTEMIRQTKNEHIYLNQLAKKEGYLQKEE